MQPLQITQITHNISVPNADIVFFALPRTVFNIDVTITEQITSPGVYRAFSKKYLNVVTKSEYSKRCAIKSITLTSSIDADPQHMYCANGSSEAIDKFRNFFGKTLLEIPDTANLYQSKFSNPEKIALSKNQPLPFEQKRVEESIEIRGTTSTRRIIRAPTEEEQAAEVAAQIFALRKRRLELTTGEFELQSADILDRMLKEIDTLLNSYLALFIDRVQTSTYTIRYTIAPVPHLLKYKIAAVSNTPIVNECLESLLLTITLLDGPVNPQYTIESPNTESIHRLPGICEVKITTADKEHLKTQMPIFQFGKFVTVVAP